MGYSLLGLDFPILFISALNCVTRGHTTRARPHPPPHRMGRFSHPHNLIHVGKGILGVGTRQWAYMALGMGLETAVPTVPQPQILKIRVKSRVSFPIYG
jgi:hypothetical protein